MANVLFGRTRRPDDDWTKAAWANYKPDGGTSTGASGGDLLWSSTTTGTATASLHQWSAYDPVGGIPYSGTGIDRTNKVWFRTGRGTKPADYGVGWLQMSPVAPNGITRHLVHVEGLGVIVADDVKPCRK